MKSGWSSSPCLICYVMQQDVEWGWCCAADCRLVEQFSWEVPDFINLSRCLLFTAGFTATCCDIPVLVLLRLVWSGLVWSTAIHAESFVFQCCVTHAFDNFPHTKLWMLYQYAVTFWLAGLVPYQYVVRTSTPFCTGISLNIFTYFTCF
jgi:hypothetical protein